MESNETVFLFSLPRKDTSGQRFENTMAPLEYDQIASYNWLWPAHNAYNSRASPIIVVPGAPKRFVQWHGGVLIEDQESRFADENRFFMDQYPLEPLVRSVLCEGHEPIAFQTLDIVTDRENLRNLFNICKDSDAFYNGKGKRWSKSFRINMERVGSKLVLFEQDTPIEYPSRPIPIYGRDFEKRCAKEYSPLTQGSYYSIVKYNLGDLCCLVRFSADCAEDYVDLKSGSDSKEQTSDMAEDVTPRPITNSKLSYIFHGYRKYNFNFNFIELTTKREDSRTYPEYIWDQLYFGCAKAAYIGWHTDGHCSYPQLLTMDELRQSGRMGSSPLIQNALRETARLLKQIVEIIRARPAGERYTLLYDMNTLTLCLRPDTADRFPEKGLLPVSLKRMLEEGEDES